MKGMCRTQVRRGSDGEILHLVASRFPVTNRLGECRSCSAWAILGLEVFPTQGLRSATLLPTNHIVDYEPALVSSSAGSPKSCPRFVEATKIPG
jgi:hypothetical protein